MRLEAIWKRAELIKFRLTVRWYPSKRLSKSKKQHLVMPFLHEWKFSWWPKITEYKVVIIRPLPPHSSTTTPTQTLRNTCSRNAKCWILTSSASLTRANRVSVIYEHCLPIKWLAADTSTNDICNVSLLFVCECVCVLCVFANAAQQSWVDFREKQWKSPAYRLFDFLLKI